MTKIGNRSRRLAAKLREILLGVKDRQTQIDAIQANDELPPEARELLIGRIREWIANKQRHANRLSTRKEQLAYDDKRPVPAADDKKGHHFPSHTTVIPENPKDSARWTPISRRECKCSRAFFAVQEAHVK